MFQNVISTGLPLPSSAAEEAGAVLPADAPEDALDDALSLFPFPDEQPASASANVMPIGKSTADLLRCCMFNHPFQMCAYPRKPFSSFVSAFFMPYFTAAAAFEEPTKRRSCSNKLQVFEAFGRGRGGECYGKGKMFRCPAEAGLRLRSDKQKRRQSETLLASRLPPLPPLSTS
jgi:hypothetical protein